MFQNLSFKHLGATVALFCIIGFLTFSPVLQSEFVTWDDNYLIVENPAVQVITPGTLKTIFSTYDPELYVPLTLLSYQVECAVHGCNSGLVHMTNLVLHIVNALLVSLLFTMLFRRGWLSLFAGLVFLVHPLNVEAVAWASARKDVLSTLFFLTSLTLFLNWKERGTTRTYWLSVFAFVLGLLSKAMVITLPVVLVLFDVHRERKLTLRMVTEKWPFWLLSVTFGIIAMFGKTQSLVLSTTFQKILMAAKSTSFYLQKFLLPTDLSVVYPFTGRIELDSLFFGIPVIVSLLTAAAIVYFWRKNSWVSVGLSFFIITLAPTFINFAKGDDIYFASDRYAYIPMIGLLMAVTYLVARFVDAFVQRRADNPKAILLSCVAMALLATLGWIASSQTGVWQSSRTLYEHALSLYPHARAMHNNLGMVELREGNVDLALRRFDTALSLGDHPKIRANRAAALMTEAERLPEARREYEQALSEDPTNKEIHFGLGTISHKEGKFDEATQHYLDALQLDPLYINALHDLALLYLQQGQYQKSIELHERLIALQPKFTAALYNLAGLYHDSGKREKAIELYSRVLRLTPADADAHASLATVLYENGDIDQAVQYLQKALDLRPANRIAYELLLRMRQDGVAK